MDFPDYLGEPATLPGRQELPRPRWIRHWPHSEWLAVSAVCLGAATSQIDNGVVTVAYPHLVKEMHRPLSQVVWIGLVSFVVLVATLLLFGRRADALGRKKIYVNGFVTFLTGSVLSVIVAHHFALLLVTRGIGALGVAMIQANSVALVTASVREHHRTTALGIQAAAQAIGLAVGPFFGSILIAHIPWRFIFIVSAPMTLLSFIASVMFLPRTRNVIEPAKLDIAGSVALALSAGGVLGGLTLAAKVGWSSNTLGMVLFGCVALIALIGVERRASAPIFEPRLFRLRHVRVSIALLVMSYVTFFGLLVAIPFFVTKDFNASARRAAEVTIAIPFGLATIAPLSGRLRSRYSGRFLVILATVVLAVAVAVMAIAPNGKVVAAMLVVVGLAIGVLNTTNNASVMSGVALEDRGLASGTVNLARAAGSALGMALATSVIVLLDRWNATSFRWSVAILLLPTVVAYVVAVALFRDDR